MFKQDRRSWLYWPLGLFLMFGAMDASAAEAVRERAPASEVKPADDAAKAAIFELIDTIVARRDLSDLEMLTKALKVGSYKQAGDKARVLYVLYPAAAISPMNGSATASWFIIPFEARIQQQLVVSLDATRVCITLDDLSVRYGEGVRERRSTHLPARQDHPFHNVSYRFNSTVSVGIAFIYQTCANDFSVYVESKGSG